MLEVVVVKKEGWVILNKLVYYVNFDYIEMRRERIIKWLSAKCCPMW